LIFLRDPFVTFKHAFDPILRLLAWGQEAGDLVLALRGGGPRLCRENDHVANAKFVGGFSGFSRAPLRGGSGGIGGGTPIGRLSEAQGLQSRGLFLQLLTLSLIFSPRVRIFGGTLQLSVFCFSPDSFR